MTAYPLKPLPANNREFPYEPAVRPKRASPPKVDHQPLEKLNHRTFRLCAVRRNTIRFPFLKPTQRNDSILLVMYAARPMHTRMDFSF